MDSSVVSPNASFRSLHWSTFPATRWGRFQRRLAYGSLALVLADVIVGFTIFSVMVLGILAFFSYGWLQLAHEYAAVGLTFGSPLQSKEAMGLMLLSPGMMVLVSYLGYHAARLPRTVWEKGKARAAAPASA